MNSEILINNLKNYQKNIEANKQGNRYKEINSLLNYSILLIGKYSNANDIEFDLLSLLNEHFQMLVHYFNSKQLDHAVSLNITNPARGQPIGNYNTTIYRLISSEIYSLLSMLKNSNFQAEVEEINSYITSGKEKLEEINNPAASGIALYISMGNKS